MQGDSSFLMHRLLVPRRAYTNYLVVELIGRAKDKIVAFRKYYFELFLRKLRKKARIHIGMDDFGHVESNINLIR